MTDHSRRGPIAVAVGALIIALLATVLAVFLFGRVQALNDDLRNGLVTSCEVNGNPLRAAVQSQLHREIQQSRSFDYSTFFPSVPPAQLHDLIVKQIAQDRAELAQIEPVDCAAQYR